MQVLGTSGTGTGTGVPKGTGGSIAGGVHGGNQPIVGATVRLYAAGTGSYGAPATLLATTTSDAGGNYSFTNGTAGPNTGNSYVCPSSGSQIYITSNSGTTDGSGNPSNMNVAATLLAALGPCGALSSTTPAYLNELTTVAAVTALSQYISPGTTPGTFSIGAPGSTQAQQGLANAVLQMQNLVNTGAAGPASQVTARNYVGATGPLSTVAGVTITATPEATKLNTMADVIAACVNQTNNTGANCLKLFAAATPPPTSQTSHPLVALPVATDTVMAAYYMAINPAQVSGTKGVVAAIGDPCNSSAMDCEFGLVSGVSPFQNTLSTAPTDWTIGVTFTSTGTCNAAGDSTLASKGYFLSGPTQESVDASGNVWFINANTRLPGQTSGATAPATVAAISPYGQPLACPGSATVAGRGITIDPGGNVWVAFATTGGSVQEFQAPTSFVGDNGVTGLTGTVGTVPAVPTSAPFAGTTPYVLVSDLAGNIFYVSAGTQVPTASVPGYGESLFELPAGGTAWTQVANIGSAVTTSGQAANNPLQIATDSKGRIWVADASSTGPIYYYPTATGYAAGTIPTPGTSSLAAYGISVANLPAASVPNYTGTGVADIVYSGSTCCGTSSTGYYKAINRYLPKSYTANSVPVYATGTTSGSSYSGLNGVRSLTVDGAGNAFAGGEYPAGGDVVSGQSTFGIFEVNASLQAVSKTGTIPTSATCATTITPVTCATFGGFEKPDFFGGMHGMAVDTSGTVWVLNTGFLSTNPGGNSVFNGVSITQVVGAGVPVTTPLSAAAAAGTLGMAP